MPGAPSLSTALLKPGASLELPVSAGAPEAPEPSLIMQNVMGLRLRERSCLIMALCVPQFLHLEGEVSQSWDTGRVRRGSCDRSVAHGCWFPGILYAESMTSGGPSFVFSHPGQLAQAGTQIVSEI